MKTLRLKGRSPYLAGLSAVVLLALCATTRADQIWTGLGNGTWNDVNDWASNPSGNTAEVPNNEVATINTSSLDDADAAIIDADFVTTPTDIYICSFASFGRLDQLSGTASASGWLYMSRNGGDSVFNLADTTTTGGAFTGYGEGTGSFSAFIIQGGDPWYNDAGGTVTINVNTTGTLAVGWDFNLGEAGATATLNLDAGTVSVGDEFRVGASAGGDSSHLTSGTMNQSGGTVITTGMLSIADGSSSDATNGSPVTGAYNMTGGNLTVNNELLVGNYGNGTLTVSGSGAVKVTDTVQGLELAVNSGSTGTVNLNGGTISTALVTSGSGTSTFNFNGGTLQATASGTSFMDGITTANVRNGGAVIDTNSYNITIAQALVHSTVGGDNATDGGLNKLGAGTLTLTGVNTYTGATTVSVGTLAIGSGGSLASTTYNIAAGATFDTSALSSYSMNGVATNITIGSAGSYGVFNAGSANTLTLTGGTLTLNFTSASLAAGQTYSLFTGSTLTGDFTSVTLTGSYAVSLTGSSGVWTGTVDGYALTYTDSTGVLAVASAIPEPATYAALAGLSALGLAFWRRRRKA